MKKFNLVVCGGTFDHFHKGHESLLRLALSLGNKVIIGVTSDDYVKNSKFRIQNSEFVEPFEERKESVLEFLKQNNLKNRAEIIKIGDLFGPTLDKSLEIDAIVVSEDTKKGAKIINAKRKGLGLKDLQILIAPQVLAEDKKLISSGRIRKGEINREGKLYVKREWFSKNLKLTEDLRNEFKKPFGELFKDVQNSFKNKNYLVITVGDITTKMFNEKSLGQNLSVIDFKVARKNKFSNILELGFAGDEKVFNVDNPAGHITSNLFKKITEIFKVGIGSKVILQISGEEDLAVLPLVLASPLNAIIYYGQPGEGIVKIEVSEKIKKIVYGLVNKFEMLK